MKITTLIFIALVLLLSCKTTQVSSQNRLITKQRSDASVISVDQRVFFGMNLKMPRGCDTTNATYGVDSLGMLYYDSCNSIVYVRVTAAGARHKWSRVAQSSDLTNYWQLSGSNLSPTSTSYNVGIGTSSPISKLDVVSGSGEMYFDGTRLGLLATSGSSNIYIGQVSGNLSNVNNNIAVGGNTLKRNTGSSNSALGYNSLSSLAIGGNNTGIGYFALNTTDSSDNTALGYASGISNYGSQNISIGSNSGNFKRLDTLLINNTEISINTSSITGSGTASFITSNSLTIGQKYPFRIIFNGTIPNPYGTTSQLFVNGAITNSNTITFTTTAFTSQGSGNFSIELYDKQRNSISIGYNVKTVGSDEIAIGNSSAATLKVGSNFIIDLTSVPSDQYALIYNAGSGKAVWQSIGGGGGGVTSVSGTSPISVINGTSTPVISIANAAADGSTKGAATFNASDFNAASGVITIDYANGQAASSSLKGFLSSTDWTTFNNKQATITGALTPYVSSNATASRAIVSDGSGKLSASSTTSTEIGYLSGVSSSIQTQLNGKLSTSLTSTQILVGNGSNVATAVTMSGDATISNAGVLTLKNSGVTAGTYASANITVDAQGRITAAADGSGGGGGGTVNSVNGTSPIVSDGDLVNPTISILNAKADGSTKGAAWFSANDFNDNGSGGISIDYTNGTAASGSTKGFLTSTDWATFNNKVSATRAVNTGTGLTGGGNLGSDLTISLSTIAGFVSAGTNVSISGSGTIASPYVINSSGGGGGSGSVTNVSGVNTNGFTFSISNPTTTPAITLSLQNAAADGTTKGQATFTANDFNATTGLISIDYTNGQTASGSTKGFLTSTDWTTFNSKQSAITGAATTVTSSNLSTNRAVISDGSGKIGVSATTSAQIGFLSTVTNDVQIQINGKEPAIIYAWQTLTDGATVTLNGANGINNRVTLAGNRTLAFSNITVGKRYFLKITQDATGSRTLTCPAGSLIAQGKGTGLVLNLSTDPLAVDIMSLVYDGTNYFIDLNNNYQ